MKSLTDNYGQRTGTSTEASKRPATFKALQQMINAEARRQGIGSKVQTTLSKDGLTVRLKTDGLLFDPGRPRSSPVRAR